MDGEICPSCCAEKRVIEIDCTPDCTHLAGSFFQHQKRLASIAESLPDSRRRREYFEVLDHLRGVVWVFEQFLVEWMVRPTALTDREAAEIYRIVRESYETESRGLLFQETSPNPLVQSAVRHLREKIEEFRIRDHEGSPREVLKVEPIAAVLRFLEAELGFYASKSDGDPQAYLLQMWRRHPRTREKRNEGLILGS